MAYPTIVGTATWTGNQNQQKAQMPAGIEAGDLILAFWHRSGGTTTAGNIDGGFTSLDSGSGTNLGARCLYKVADGSESNALLDLCHFSSGSDNAITLTVVLRGWAAGPVSSGYGADATADTTANPPSCTSGWGVVDTLYLAWAGCNTQAAVPPSSGPSGYSQQAYDSRTSCAAVVYTKTVTAASDDPGTLTWASGTPNEMTLTMAVQGPARVPRHPFVHHNNPGIV
jgi:hypothetical protein